LENDWILLLAGKPCHLIREEFFSLLHTYSPRHHLLSWINS
jgi:hypothetical protein